MTHLPDIDGTKVDANQCMFVLLPYRCPQVTHHLALPNVNQEGSIGFAENPTEEFEFVI